MRIIIFGTGLFYKNRRTNINRKDIIAFIDNNKEVQETIVDGCLVLSVDRGIQLDYDYIVLMARNDNRINMESQLLELGVQSNKILDYYQYLNYCKEQSITFYYRNNGQTLLPKTGQKILLLSHELSMTGAPIVLFNAALLIKKNGFTPVIMSPYDGELRQKFIENDILVVIEKNITKANGVIWNWMLTFDLIWVNTLSFSYLIDDLSSCGVPAVWWLHEGDISYEIIGMNRMPKTSRIMDVYAVGYQAMDSFKRYLGRDEISCLLYGIPDEKPREKIHFMLSGTISTRKAQDVLVDAIMLLSEETREKADFTIIGNIVEQHIYDYIVQKAQNIDNLKILDGVSHEEMLQMYENIDVIVCPSRVDPMPVVVTEGLMNSKVCIVSGQTGSAKIITDGKDGVICEVSAESLAQKIEWVICNYENLDAMKENARKLYLEKFSMDVFEKNVLQILQNKINENSVCDFGKDI